MEYRFLGRTGVRISQLALGTMSFGGDADDATSAALFARARDAGINFFDCADVYAKGRSEEILGKLVSGCRDELVISTKAYFPTGTDPNARGSSRFHLVRAVEASLKRLATDRIDLFFLHRFDEMTAVDETLSALETLIQQGKILYPAVSNFSAWQTAKTLAVAELRRLCPIVASQPMYNLVKRQAEVEILPHAVSEGLAVVTYSPLAGGLLSGKYGVGKAPAKGRVVENAMYKTRYGAASNFEIAEAFTALAHQLGHHPATLAIAWVAAQPGVTAPLIGARSLEQLEPCLAAASLTLSAEVLARIGALSPEPPPATDRNEEKSAHNYGSR
ncbi:MAG: aldo/keto reductase [Myxococcales bacterium]|nr:aldo/keto reductase [Myxococcales bacterium]